MIIFKSDVFERFVAEYGSSDKISDIEVKRKASLREILVQSAGLIGTLRYLSKMRGWNLTFEGMTYRFSEQRSVEIDLDEQIIHLRGRSQGTSMPDADIVKQEIASARVKFPEPLRHIAGHDLCAVISRGVHRVFGRAHVALGRGGEAVEEVFRASYSLENFLASAIYKKLREWEARTVPFRVLPAP
jgi:hypothetical protein